MARASNIHEDEQANYQLLECINSHSEKKKAAEEDNRQKQMEEREKARLNTMGLNAIRCIIDVVIFVALFGAMKAELIASAIVIPATYLCAIHFGWCANRVAHLVRKGRGGK